MGNTCCQKPKDELILETYENKEANNNEASEEMNKGKDKYPHDSDSAFKRRKLEELKGNIEPIINKIDEEEQKNEFGNEFEIENENENENGNE